MTAFLLSIFRFNSSTIKIHHFLQISNEEICHFCKRMLWFPYPRTENYKQWNVEEVHKIVKCHAFDDDLNEYLEWKKDAEREKVF